MEEFECNPLYLALQSKFRKEYELAQHKSCVVLIPSTCSLQNLEISANLLYAHIFRPSPYFKGQYVPLYGDENKTLQIEEDIIQRLAGFEDSEDVKILSEEKGYNQDGKSFYIYIIERPLQEFKEIKEKVKELNVPKSWLDGSTSPTISECRQFLHELCKGKALENLDNKTSIILKNYLFLPEYLEDASKKLYGVIDRTVKDILADELNIGIRTSSVLFTVVESYVMSNMHCKLFPIICQRFSSDDTLLKEKLILMHKLDVTPAQLGARELFSCKMPASIVELARLDSLSSPREKIQSLKNTMDLIVAEVKQHLQETRGLLTPPGGLPSLTADDFIPVLLNAVINAKLYHLKSNLYYMENFLWSISMKDAHGYSLTTFKAVIELLKTYDISLIKPAKDQQKKELSLEELMKVTEKLELKNRTDPSDTESKAEWTPVDRQMERIAKMIEASTRDLSSVQNYGVQSTCK